MKKILLALVVAFGLVVSGASAAGADSPDRSWCVVIDHGEYVFVTQTGLTQRQAERIAAKQGASAAQGDVCNLGGTAAALHGGGHFTLQTGTYADVLTQEARVASTWTKGTDADVRVGDCVGTAGCISVKVVDTPCGTANPGCAYGWSYASGCVVEVSQWVVDWSRDYGLPDFEFNVLGHEVGHCLIGSAWHDTSSERSIMYPSLHYGDRAKRVTKPVRDMVNLRF